ncbi:MAG: serine/threonine protein kinase [Myxococcota bacterium]|jgi:serine/threonine protein kinase
MLAQWVIDEVLEMAGTARYRAHRAGDPTDEVRIEMAARDARDGLRLRREAFALRHMDHDALPRIIDKGELDDGRFFWVATRWFDGEVLADILRDKPMRWEDASSVFYQLASGVLAVHESGMVHRDIHPTKVEVSASLRVRLVGFELAMTQDELGRVARPPLGDLAYVAPEVIADRNHHVARADLYSLGVLFYEVLTGVRAFPAALWGDRADPEARMIAWKSRADALDPGPDIPRWLRNLIQKATHPNPEKRLPDMDAMVGWLDAARDQWSTPTPVTRVVAPAPPPLPPVLVGIAPSILPPVMMAAAPPPVAQESANQPFPFVLAYALAGMMGVVAGTSIGLIMLMFMGLDRVASLG